MMLKFEKYKPRQHGCFAHFPETGPEGTRCFDCESFTQVAEKGPCDKFRLLTGREGLPIDCESPSCKYYVEKIKICNLDDITSSYQLRLAMILTRTDADSLADWCDVKPLTVCRWMLHGAPEKRREVLTLSFEGLIPSININVKEELKK